MNKWKNLQNGSDIRGVALDGIDDEPITLTPNISRTIGWAFSYWLKDKLGLNNIIIAVGHDSRISSEIIKNAVFEGIIHSDSECIAVSYTHLRAHET